MFRKHGRSSEKKTGRGFNDRRRRSNREHKRRFTKSEHTQEVTADMYEKTVYIQLDIFESPKELEILQEKLQEHSTDRICVLPSCCRVINMEDLEHVTIRIAKIEEGQ